MGAEWRGKGVNVALGPMMILARVAAGGRNWEGFGAGMWNISSETIERSQLIFADPFLAGEAAAETIKGIQSQGVQATCVWSLFSYVARNLFHIQRCVLHRRRARAPPRACLL